MAIPSVIGGTVETDTSKVKLDSSQGAAWLETISSFRYEPTGDGKPYTVRKEGKNGEYWYGCRKIEKKVRKKYIGKSSEITIAKLEEIAEALEVPPEPRVKQVVEVAEQVAEVTQSPCVAEGVAESRVTALESQVAELLEAVKDLQEALPGKSDAGDSVELPKVDNEVVERLQNELGNLKAENERLRQSLEKSDTLINLRNQEIATLNSRLAAKDETIAEASGQCDEFEKWWHEEKKEVADRDKEIAELRSELSDLKQNSVTASQDLPDLTEKAGELLSFFKSLLPKNVKLANGTISKIEKILEG